MDKLSPLLLRKWTIKIMRDAKASANRRYLYARLKPEYGH